ncbi:MAG: peptidylprolyl isomerase [bacterium]
MAEAKNGDTVKVHYTGKLDDGTQFDSSMDRDPLEFTLGEQRLIKGFETAVIGMSVGDTKSVKIPVEEGYGPHRDDLVVIVDRGELPADLDPKVGEKLEMRQSDKSFIVRVIEVTSKNVTLDANHPLAGEALNFEIELVDIA